MGFVYPYFLFGLLAVAIPIVIHLFNLRRFKKVYFTNVEALKQIELETRKANKTNNILLLLLRCLIIALIVLLFAKPYIKDESRSLVREGGNTVLVFVDNSFSMENAANKGSLLDKAKDRAREIAMQYSSSDAFCLMTQELSGKERHFLSREDFLAALSEVELSPASLPLSQIIKQTHAYLASNGKREAVCFFLSDFQASMFDQEAFPKDSIEDVFVPLHAENAANVFVDSLWFENALIKKGEQAVLNVKITNHSPQEVEKLPVKLFVSGKQLTAATADIAEMSSETLQLSFSVPESGILHSKISINDSPVSFDDDSFFTLLVRDRVKVLSINASGENKYLSRLFSRDADVEFENMSAQNPDFSRLDYQSMVILNGLNELTSGFTAEIEAFLQKGGSLIVLPGEKMNLESCNEALARLSLPCFEPMRQTSERVADLDVENKLFKGVFTSLTDNMEMPTVRKYYPLARRGAVAAQSIMRLSGGDDFLVVSPRAECDVYMFCSPFEEQWSNFPLQSLFVPTLWNMCTMSRKLPKVYYTLDKEPLIDLSAFTALDNNQVLTVKNTETSQSFIPQMLKQGGKTSLRLLGQTKHAGSYDILQGDSLRGGFSLNYPRSESRLEFLDEGELKNRLAKSGISSSRVFSSRALAESQIAKSDVGFSFTVVLILLSLIAIGAEIVLLHSIRKTK